MQIGPDTKAVLLAAAAMFQWALLLGVWKYRQIATSDRRAAHAYVDIAHRAALLYSFALLLVAVFVELSGWSTAVNAIAAGAMATFFFCAVGNYTLLGWRGETDNQFRGAPHSTHIGMAALIVAEIGGWLILSAGFLERQVF